MQQQALADNSVPLADFITLKTETLSPSKAVQSAQEFIVLDTNHAYEGRIQFRGRVISADGIGSVKRPLRAGYVIISRLRTYLRQIALIDEFVPEFDGLVLCSTEFYVLAPTEGADIAFLVPFLLSADVQRIFAAAEEGGHHPRIKSDILMNLLVPKWISNQRDEISKRFKDGLRQIRDGERLQDRVHAEFVNDSLSIEGEPRHRQRASPITGRRKTSG